MGPWAMRSLAGPLSRWCSPSACTVQPKARVMQPQHISEAILALVLALTLSLKIAVGPTVASEEIVTGNEASVAAFLEQQGFTVGALLPDISPPMLPAR